MSDLQRASEQLEDAVRCTTHDLRMVSTSQSYKLTSTLWEYRDKSDSPATIHESLCVDMAGSYVGIADSVYQVQFYPMNVGGRCGVWLAAWSWNRTVPGKSSCRVLGIQPTASYNEACELVRDMIYAISSYKKAREAAGIDGAGQGYIGPDIYRNDEEVRGLLDDLYDDD